MSAPATTTAPAPAGTIVVGVEHSEYSFYALKWTLRRFFAAGIGGFAKLVVVHAKPTPTSLIGFSGPGASEMLPLVENDLKKIASRVIDMAKELCASYSVGVAEYETVDGDPRNVLCQAVEKHQAEILIVGSHGHSAIKKSSLGGVSDFCAHNAQCTVMIVKKPVPKH